MGFHTRAGGLSVECGLSKTLGPIPSPRRGQRKWRQREGARERRRKRKEGEGRGEDGRGKEGGKKNRGEGRKVEGRRERRRGRGRRVRGREKEKENTRKICWLDSWFDTCHTPHTYEKRTVLRPLWPLKCLPIDNVIKNQSIIFWFLISPAIYSWFKSIPYLTFQWNWLLANVSKVSHIKKKIKL
jgi:hypothetical protein